MQKESRGKIEVLLLGVDQSYQVSRKRYQEKSAQIFERCQINWPDVLLEKGWDDVQESFNLGGYGISVIDEHGIVRGINVGKRQLEKLLKDCGAFGAE